MTDTEHDHIDALAREAGSALRRAPSPGVLLRVHRAKRNRQITRAAAGTFALVALVAGGIVLATRGRDEQLVPATVPPTPAPVTAPPASSVPDTSSPDTRVTTLAPEPASTAATTVPTTVAALAAAPEVLYLGDDDRTLPEQVQRVVDLDTLEVIATEPLDDAASGEFRNDPEPRFTSSTGITYGLATWPGDDPADGLPVTDWCGRYPVEVDGAPAGTLAVPELASYLAVSDDGRWVLTIGAEVCPVDGLVDPSMNVEQINYEQQVRLFDADDPTAPGRLLWTSPYPERRFTGASFTSDGRWMALTHDFEDGLAVSQRGLDVIELATGQPLETSSPGCSIVDYGQFGEVFVADDAVALTTSCEDDGGFVDYVELYPLDRSASPLLVQLDGVPGRSTHSVEVWPQLGGGVTDASYVVTVYADAAAGTPNRTFVGRGDALSELPFTDARASFGPLPEIVGD